MDKTNEMLNDIIELMKQKYGAAVTEVNGFNFSAVDIGIYLDVYRIIILRHNQTKSKEKNE